jgi:hypothetical protein
MMAVIRISGALALLGVAAFCLVGFLESFEPGLFLAWRFGYAAVGLASVLAAAWILGRLRLRSPNQFR